MNSFKEMHFKICIQTKKKSINSVEASRVILHQMKCIQMLQVVASVPNVSAIINFAFPMMTAEGPRGVSSIKFKHFISDSTFVQLSYKFDKSVLRDSLNL